MRRKKQWIINLLLPLAVIDSSMAEMEPTLDELLDGFEEDFGFRGEVRKFVDLKA